MTLDLTSIDPANEAGPLSSPPATEPEPATAAGAAPRSWISHCIARLFGIDAFLSESADRDDWRLSD